MALVSGETINSENMLREIQSERMIYQIHSSSDARKAADKMKKSTEEITKAIENARNIAYKKKIATDEMKINLSEKKEKMKKLQQELNNIRKRVELNAKKTSDLNVETNKIKTAIDKIKEAAQDLDSKYFERSQNELIDSLVKVTSEAEKAQSDLNATKRMEVITSKKLQDVEIDFNKSEAHTIDEIKETERIIVNVSTTIEHIIRSYDEITVVSKDLLKSAIVTKGEFEEGNNYQLEQSQPNKEFSDAKVAI